MKSSQLIRVVGPPRSGTNLTKYLIDIFSSVLAGFDIGCWKHAPINKGLLPNDSFFSIPTIVMYRSYKSQLASLYKLSLENAVSFQADTNPTKFVNSCVVMSTPSRKLNLSFKSPIDYLLQYYSSALSFRPSRIHFLSLEDILLNPSIIKSILKKEFSNVEFYSEISLPSSYLARNSDYDFNQGNCFNKTTSVEREKIRSFKLFNTLSITPLELSPLIKIYESLQYNK